MRFFSRGWTNGDIPGDEADHISRNYQAHIAKLLPNLPASIAQLATKVGLHDAIIEQVRLDRGRRTIELSLIGLRGEAAYQSIRLRYIDYQAHDRILETLKARARDRETQILQSEVDQDPDGTFVHRLLFWPDSELSLWFSRLELTVTPRQDKLVHLGPFFLEEEVEEDDQGPHRG